MTRAEAKLLGLSHYFTGAACKRGHVSRRRTRDGHCLRCRADGQLAWERDNPEEARRRNQAVQRAWAERNPELVRARRKRYRDAHPETGRQHARRRRARKRNQLGTVGPNAEALLLAKQCGRCAGCAAALTAVGYHVDHMVPLSRGGLHDYVNLQLLCGRCNDSKGVKTMEEWAGTAFRGVWLGV